MKFSTKLFSSILFAGVLCAFPSSVVAGCTTQYGGTVTCPPTDITINKFVAKPRVTETVETKGGTKVVTKSDLVFQDNLGIENAYKAGEEVVFKLKIHNNSVKTYTNIRVVDKFPDFVKFTSGEGTLEKDGKTLVFFIDKLGVGETREYQLTADVVPFKELTGPDNFCLQNRGEVSVEDRAHNDTAQFCISKTEPAKKLPVAGFNDMALMIPFIGIGLSGFALLRKRS